MAPKKRKLASMGAAPPPPPQNPENLITREAEDNYISLSVRPFVDDILFLSNTPNFHLFLNDRRHWKKIFEHPNLRLASIVRAFHANLHDMIGSTVFVQGVGYHLIDRLSIDSLGSKMKIVKSIGHCIESPTMIAS